MSKIIDADALRKKLEVLASDPWNMEANTTWSEAYEQFCMELDEAPDLNCTVLEEVETIYPCTVQILRNPKTWEESVGWFRGKMDG